MAGGCSSLALAAEGDSVPSRKRFPQDCGHRDRTPTDNVSELTVSLNHNGWGMPYKHCLSGSRLQPTDLERNISSNMVCGGEYARQVGATICGVVGRDGGFTARVADACVVVPVVNVTIITPHTESFQALVWHLLVSLPRLKASETKWESMQAPGDGRDAASTQARR